MTNTIIAWTLIFSFFGGGVVPALALPTSDPQIRIALVKDARQLDVEIRGSFTMDDGQTGLKLNSGRRLTRRSIRPDPLGLKVGAELYRTKNIQFFPQEDLILYLNGKVCRYRGRLDVIVTPQAGLLVINRIGLEEYVRGILFHEVSHRWPMEALKAQAVVSRTYAIYQIQANQKNEFDVTSDIYSQVYGGRSAERYRTNLAVERSAGEVLVYEGKILPAYFHATCAGKTEDVAELWKNVSIPPLRGVRCNFCGHSPHSFWKKSIALKDIEKQLAKEGKTVGPISGITILERNASGRIRILEISGLDGRKILITGKDFRQIIGPNIIRSNDYYVVIKETNADFSGRGWGHGVGMCQWGAYGMASRGYDYQQILSYYYPGVRLVAYTSLPKQHN